MLALITLRGLHPRSYICGRKITYNICPPIPKVRIVPFGIPSLGSLHSEKLRLLMDGHLMLRDFLGNLCSLDGICWRQIMMRFSLKIRDRQMMRKRFELDVVDSRSGAKVKKREEISLIRLPFSPRNAIFFPFLRTSWILKSLITSKLFEFS